LALSVAVKLRPLSPVIASCPLIDPLPLPVGRTLTVVVSPGFILSDERAVDISKAPVVALVTDARKLVIGTVPVLVMVNTLAVPGCNAAVVPKLWLAGLMDALGPNEVVVEASFVKRLARS